MCGEMERDGENATGGSAAQAQTHRAEVASSWAERAARVLQHRICREQLLILPLLQNNFCLLSSLGDTTTVFYTTSLETAKTPREAYPTKSSPSHSLAPPTMSSSPTDVVEKLPSTAELKEDVAKATKKSLQSLRDFAAGGVGGIFAVVVGHPFDLVKVRMQTAEKGVYSGAMDVVRKTIAKEGMARVRLCSSSTESRGHPTDLA